MGDAAEFVPVDIRGRGGRDGSVKGVKASVGDIEGRALRHSGDWA